MRSKVAWQTKYNNLFEYKSDIVNVKVMEGRGVKMSEMLDKYSNCMGGIFIKLFSLLLWCLATPEEGPHVIIHPV